MCIRDRIGAGEYFYHRKKEEGKYVKGYINKTNRFIRLSSTASYFHHATVLSAILGLIDNDPRYFEHWKSPTFILNKYHGYCLENKYYIFAGVIGIGLIGLLISIYLGASGMKIAIAEAEKRSPAKKEKEKERP